MMQSVTSLETPVETPTKPRRRRNRLIAGAVLLLLALIVLPPYINISRFRRTIVRSISAGLGRPVEASSVELVLFPRPGFVLHNLTVGEDPAFGDEPVMMAETVTAGLRASTLWHARVEIATLRFDTPSVNLVRNAEGHWNFESLLRNSPALRSRGGALVSTTPGRRLPFPYVEATDARINFKLGPEKLPFSLEKADLAVWKESRHEWRLRIKARPIRTDLTVMDAGQIRGEGTLMTGGPLTIAPVRAKADWRNVQLGEINRLLRGRDGGWRGIVDWTTLAQGTLADVSLQSDISIEELRRAEFIPAAEMDISAHCIARYARNNQRLNAIECNAPVGDGHVLLRSAGSLPQTTHESASVQVALRQVPAGSFLNLLGHIHPGISGDTTASGELNGHADCTWPALAVPMACTGEIRSPQLRLDLAHFDRPLTFSPFLLASSPGLNRAAPISAAPDAWKLAPLHVALGGATPATITGTTTSAGFALQIAGAADLAELARLAESLKVPVISGEVQSIHGSAQLALSLESAWLPHVDTGLQPLPSTDSTKPIQPTGFSPANWTGSVQVRNATLKLAMLPGTLQLTSGQVDVTPDEVQWSALNGTFAHIPFEGRIQWQTPCPASGSACARTFTLHTPNLNAGHLEAALRNAEGGSDLLNLINPWAAGVPQLPEISGTVNADTLTAGKISLKDAALSLRMKGQTAELQSISGKLFGGTVSTAAAEPRAVGTSNPVGSGSVHWGDGAPVYRLRAILQHADPDRVGAIWHEDWGRGTANLQIDLKTQGRSAAELAHNASGKFNVEWLNGSLSGLTAASPTPAIEKFQRWSARGAIGNEALVFGSSQIVPLRGLQRTQNTTQSVTGTVSFARVLDLRLEPSGSLVSGPLNAPVITPSSGKTGAQPETEINLKTPNQR